MAAKKTAKKRYKEKLAMMKSLPKPRRTKTAKAPAVERDPKEEPRD